ncbi:putative quinol monooxygenase [Mesorhizobium sp. WSM4313]|uniref:putative quinol monooxygenase n=1 Tax=Mesorhizobium sp. WSM4313 TaxID=2029412 RepID=UPI000BAF7299|nr:putative quinol monooxygenase [Mesorhizobium sp. WSM4313]PBB20072.1 antibiotic biosynthesis monooxygenase [Mesorhizobium sp. WSM4313]
MLLIIGTVRLPPDRLDQAKPAMQRMIMASRAEPGCLDYSYAQDVLDAGLIHVSEAWSDRAALEAHFKSAHIAEWRASWAELGIGERKLTLFETDGGAPT